VVPVDTGCLATCARLRRAGHNGLQRRIKRAAGDRFIGTETADAEHSSTPKTAAPVSSGV